MRCVWITGSAPVTGKDTLAVITQRLRVTLCILVHTGGPSIQIFLVFGRLLLIPLFAALRNPIDAYPTVLLDVFVVHTGPKIFGRAAARFAIQFQDQIAVALHRSIAITEEQPLYVLRVHVRHAVVVPKNLNLRLCRHKGKRAQKQIENAHVGKYATPSYPKPASQNQIEGYCNLSSRIGYPFVISLPERLVRSLSALTGGLLREAGVVLLPARLRRTALYRVMVEVTLRFLIEELGRVKGVYRRARIWKISCSSALRATE